MKLIAQNYISPDNIGWQLKNVMIKDKGFEIQGDNKYFRIDFEMYLKDNQEVILVTSSLAFQGMDSSENNTTRKATFKFIDDTEEQDPRGLIKWLIDNNGDYPTNYKMIDWGYPSYEQALSFLTGGTLDNPEINPINNFVEDWLKNTLVMKGEFIGKQFEFEEKL